MEGLRTKAVESGTSIKPETKSIHETGNNGAWKNVMEALMLLLKESEIKAEDIALHMHQWHT